MRGCVETMIQLPCRTLCAGQCRAFTLLVPGPPAVPQARIVRSFLCWVVLGLLQRQVRGPGGTFLSSKDLPWCKEHRGPDVCGTSPCAWLRCFCFFIESIPVLLLPSETQEVQQPIFSVARSKQPATEKVYRVYTKHKYIYIYTHI